MATRREDFQRLYRGKEDSSCIPPTWRLVRCYIQRYTRTQLCERHGTLWTVCDINRIELTNFQHLHADEPPAYRSPSPIYASPGPEATPSQNRSVIDSVGPYNTMDERPADNQHLGDARASAFNPATSSPQNSVAAVASSVANAIPISGEDIKAQLAEAKAQILKLKDQAQEQVQHLRKSDAVKQDSKGRLSTGTTGMGMQQQPAEGVPVPIVAALCLLSFLLAYFFF